MRRSSLKLRPKKKVSLAYLPHLTSPILLATSPKEITGASTWTTWTIKVESKLFPFLGISSFRIRESAANVTTFRGPSSLKLLKNAALTSRFKASTSIMLA